MCKIQKGYQTLIEQVLPVVKNFKEDITKHDKAALENYQGDFISLYRESGTHLFKCDDYKSLAKWAYRDPQESLKLTLETNLLTVSMNQSYLYIKADGSFEAIAAEKVTSVMLQRYEDAKRFYDDSFKKMNFEGIASIIEFYMLQFGKTWKSKLTEEWDSQYASPEARKIRNYFGVDFLKSIKLETKKEETKKSLIEYYMRDK